MSLKRWLSKDLIINVLKGLGEKGARRLEEFLLKQSSNYLSESKLGSITLDADSTVSIVYGNQQGAAKGYNDKKRG